MTGPPGKGAAPLSRPGSHGRRLTDAPDPASVPITAVATRWRAAEAEALRQAEAAREASGRWARLRVAWHRVRAQRRRATADEMFRERQSYSNAPTEEH